jgi:cytochrome c5
MPLRQKKKRCFIFRSLLLFGTLFLDYCFTLPAIARHCRIDAKGKLMRALLGIVILAGLNACSASVKEPGAADLERAALARPADPQLAERYERSCMACHSVLNSGAPLTAFAPHWSKRLDQGMDLMVKHASEGLNAMPAKGQCNDCSTDDLRALTEFMIGSRK